MLEYNTCSKILQHTLVNEIGLQFDTELRGPLLRNGTTLPIFQSCGRTEYVKDKLNNNTRYIVRTGAQDLSIMLGIPSGHGAALVFRFCRSLRTPQLSTIMLGMLSYEGHE